MRIYSCGLVVFFFALSLGACTSARESQQADTTPGQTAGTVQSMEDQLVEQSIVAMGGLETITAIQSVQSTGSVEIPQMGMTIPLKIYQKRPNMVRSEVEIAQMNATIVSGYDGEIAWTINPMQGTQPQKLPESQTRAMKDQADIDGFLVGYKEKGLMLEYLGEPEVNGSPAHALRILRPDSSEVLYYLDAESYLPIKQESEGPNPMSGEMAQMETYFSDYRDVSGMMMPHMVEVHMNGQVFQRVKIDEVKVNEAVSDVLFAFPGTVKTAE